MTPNAGQGGGTAIEDVAALALLLPACAEHPEQIPDALSEMRRERVLSIQKIAWRIGRVAQWRNPLLRSVRNAVLNSVPPSVVDTQARTLWAPGIELAAQLQAGDDSA